MEWGVIMENSQKFKLKYVICAISSVLITGIAIYLFLKCVLLNLVPYFEFSIINMIFLFITISILIWLISYLLKLNKVYIEYKIKVCDELDNNLEKVFTDYGLYLTKNYIVCLGSKLDLLKLFVVPIKDINAIDTHWDSRYFYKKKNSKSKKSFLSFIIAAIKTNIVFGDSDRVVFNIICDKNIYCVTTAHRSNKYKKRKINEMADYICDRYKDIDYI